MGPVNGVQVVFYGGGTRAVRLVRYAVGIVGCNARPPARTGESVVIAANAARAMVNATLTTETVTVNQTSIQEL